MAQRISGLLLALVSLGAGFLLPQTLPDLTPYELYAAWAALGLLALIGIWLSLRTPKLNRKAVGRSWIQLSEDINGDIAGGLRPMGFEYDPSVGEEENGRRWDFHVNEHQRQFLDDLRRMRERYHTRIMKAVSEMERLHVPLPDGTAGRSLYLINFHSYADLAAHLSVEGHKLADD